MILLRQSQVSVVNTRRMLRVFGIVMLLVGEFLPLSGAGAVVTTFGILWVARAERYAENAIRRRTGSPG
jgi:hypothetical protein